MESHFECMNSYQTDMLWRIEVKVLFCYSFSVVTPFSNIPTTKSIWVRSTIQKMFLCKTGGGFFFIGIYLFVIFACCKVKSITKYWKSCTLNLTVKAYSNRHRCCYWSRIMNHTRCINESLWKYLDTAFRSAIHVK